MKVIKISKEDWVKDFSENAHKTVFGELKPKEWDRIDFALAAINEKDELAAYVTCREFDHQSLYWQYGGALPNTKGSVYSAQCMKAFLGYCQERYARVGFYVENDNFPMLKMALMFKIPITGVRYFNAKVLVEHKVEFWGG